MQYISLKLKENNYRLLVVVLLFLSSLSISFALITEYVFHHKPCNLCLYQRIPYYLIIASSIIAFFLRTRILLYVIAALFLSNTAIASYHVGVEHKYFALPASCSSAELPADIVTAEQMLKYLEAETPSCDKPVVLLLNISMAELNAIFCLMISMFIFAFLKGSAVE